MGGNTDPFKMGGILKDFKINFLKPKKIVLEWIFVLSQDFSLYKRAPYRILLNGELTPLVHLNSVYRSLTTHIKTGAENLLKYENPPLINQHLREGCLRDELQFTRNEFSYYILEYVYACKSFL